MRTVLVLVAVAAVAVCFACTYSIPKLNSLSDAGQVGTEASDGEPGFGDGNDGVDEGSGSSSGGHPGDAGMTDAACTGGSLCPCSTASDCSTATPICAQAADVGGDLGHAGFCTKPCCTSGDCSAGSVCFASGQGGDYCVDPTWLGRSVPTTTAIGGAPCTSGAQCRSGLCIGTTNQVCADTCCSFAASAECTGPTQCAFGFFQGTASFDTHYAARCGPVGGSGTAGSLCSVSSQCAGGLCYTNVPPEDSAFCVQPCATQTECGSGFACQLDINGNDIYAGCFNLYGNGNAPEGAGCSEYTSCLGGLCNAGLCSNICFSDAVCSVSGWSCKPELDTSYPLGPQNQEYTVLACGP
jgi:hypothetical protein